MLYTQQTNQLSFRQYVIDLMERARDFEEDVREEALKELRSIDKERLKSILIDIINDLNEDVTPRGDAADILVEFYSHEGIAAIIPHLGSGRIANGVVYWS